MKVMILNNVMFGSSVGGAQRVAEVQAKRFVASGHEVVTIGSSSFSGLTSFGLEGQGVSGFKHYKLWIPNICAYSSLAKLPLPLRYVWHVVDRFNIWGAFKFARILKREKPDLVYTHNLIGLGMLIPFVIRRAGVDHIHKIHDVQLVEPSGHMDMNHQEDSVGQRIHSFFTKKLMGSPRLVVSPSKFLMDFYLDRGFFKESEVKVVTPVVNVKETKEIKPNFLFVGSLSEHKGANLLPDMFEEILQVNKDAKLDIVGSGPLKSELEKWGSDKNVTIHGSVPAAEVKKFYEKASVLLFPSTCIENRPNVILEAVENGLTVVASKTGGVPELAKLFGENRIYLVDSRSVEEFGKVVKGLLD